MNHVLHVRESDSVVQCMEPSTCIVFINCDDCVDAPEPDDPCWGTEYDEEARTLHWVMHYWVIGYGRHDYGWATPYWGCHVKDDPLGFFKRDIKDIGSMFGPGDYDVEVANTDDGFYVMYLNGMASGEPLPPPIPKKPALFMEFTPTPQWLL